MRAAALTFVVLLATAAAGEEPADAGSEAPDAGADGPATTVAPVVPAIGAPEAQAESAPSFAFETGLLFLRRLRPHDDHAVLRRGISRHLARLLALVDGDLRDVLLA